MANDQTALLNHRLRPEHTVLPHPGQDDDQQLAAINGRKAPQHRIDRRAAEVFRRRLLNAQHALRAIGFHRHMKITGRDINMPRLHRVAIARFHTRPLRDPRQMLRKDRRKRRRHMLGDEDRLT